jgi:hypothetical protein
MLPAAVLASQNVCMMCAAAPDEEIGAELVFSSMAVLAFN